MKAEQEAMETSGRELPGFRKRSFALPYRGGMIWFEHLDGLGRSCQLTLEKLRADEPAFHLPSAPGCVAFVLTDSKITPEITSCLYTGVATDTGCFRFSNTTAETHRAAAALIEAGADVEKLNERLFESRSHARVIAERMALESLEFYYDDRCALICLTWDQIQAAGVAGAELEDLTSLPRSIEGVEVGLTLRQQKDGSFKISVRTGHDTNACNIARRLGGGGHPRAAGCEISGNPDNAKHAILEEVKKELDRVDAEKEAQ